MVVEAGVVEGCPLATASTTVNISLRGGGGGGGGEGRGGGGGSTCIVEQCIAAGDK